MNVSRRGRESSSVHRDFSRTDSISAWIVITETVLDGVWPRCDDETRAGRERWWQRPEGSASLDRVQGLCWLRVEIREETTMLRLFILCTAMLSAVSAFGQSQPYPNKPVHVLAGSAPGNAGDV